MQIPRARVIFPLARHERLRRAGGNGRSDAHGLDASVNVDDGEDVARDVGGGDAHVLAVDKYVHRGVFAALYADSSIDAHAIQ